MNYFFVLGARDPEMVEITRVLDAQGIPHAHATIAGVPVRSSEAYRATGVQGLIPRDAHIVFVECTVTGLIPDDVCDHHNPGDPGFGMPPERFMEGSSLGQVLTLLGLTPTDEQRVIGAADHCLRHAYEGRCPGIDPKVLADWRERSRSSIRGISVEEIQGRIELAMAALKAAPRIQVEGADVAFFSATAEFPEEVPEASARIGIPFCYVHVEGKRGKAGIMSAPPSVIRTWMRTCGLKNVYGDPARGFAGGYY
jgi:hypothetical protein